MNKLDRFSKLIAVIALVLWMVFVFWPNPILRMIEGFLIGWVGGRAFAQLIHE